MEFNRLLVGETAPRGPIICVCLACPSGNFDAVTEIWEKPLCTFSNRDILSLLVLIILWAIFPRLMTAV